MKHLSSNLNRDISQALMMHPKQQTGFLDTFNQYYCTVNWQSWAYGKGHMGRRTKNGVGLIPSWLKGPWEMFVEHAIHGLLGHVPRKHRKVLFSLCYPPLRKT